MSSMAARRVRVHTFAGRGSRFTPKDPVEKKLVPPVLPLLPPRASARRTGCVVSFRGGRFRCGTPSPSPSNDLVLVTRRVSIGNGFGVAHILTAALLRHADQMSLIYAAGPSE